MARANKTWRMLAVMGAAIAAFALMTAAFAQAPPSPPHQFFGDASSGSGATIDGQPAPDGTTVTAQNENGETVGTTTVSGGLWLIQVDPADATTVTFWLDGVSASSAQTVESGALTALALAASGTAPPPTTPTVPSTGTGGLAGDGSGFPVLPLALAAAVVVALGGVAATRRGLRLGA